MLWDFRRVERIEEDYNDYHPEQNANIQEIQKIVLGNGYKRRVWTLFDWIESSDLVYNFSICGAIIRFVWVLGTSWETATKESYYKSYFYPRLPRRQNHISCAIMPPMLIPMMCTFCHFKSSKTAKASCAIRWVVQRISPGGYPEYPVPRLSTAQTCGRNKGSVFVSKVATSPSNFEAFKFTFDLKFPKNPLGWIWKKRHIFFFGGKVLSLSLSLAPADVPTGGEIGFESFV